MYGLYTDYKNWLPSPDKVALGAEAQLASVTPTRSPAHFMPCKAVSYWAVCFLVRNRFACYNALRRNQPSEKFR